MSGLDVIIFPLRFDPFLSVFLSLRALVAFLFVLEFSILFFDFLPLRTLISLFLPLRTFISVPHPLRTFVSVLFILFTRSFRFPRFSSGFYSPNLLIFLLRFFSLPRQSRLAPLLVFFRKKPMSFIALSMVYALVLRKMRAQCV